MECVFCKEIEEDGTKSWDLGDFYVKANIAPYRQSGSENHLMLIPKRHVEKLSEFSKKERERFFDLVFQINEQYRKQLGKVVHLLRQESTMQSQKHLHYHFLPDDAFIGTVQREEYVVPTINLTKIK